MAAEMWLCPLSCCLSVCLSACSRKWTVTEFISKLVQGWTLRSKGQKSRSQSR